MEKVAHRRMKVERRRASNRKGKGMSSSSAASSRGRVGKAGRRKGEKKKKKHVWWRRDYSLLLPTNEEDEKFVFLIADAVRTPLTVLPDPCFNYSWYPDGKKPPLLDVYAMASFEYYNEAVWILDAVIREFGSEGKYLEAVGGRLLTTEESVDFLKMYIRNHGLESDLGVELVEKQVSPTVLKKNCVSVRVPVQYRRGTVMGVCNHEIGTHFLRRVNEGRQVWCGRRGDYRLEDATETEEGLASLHGELNKPWKFLWKAALHYYSVCAGSRMGFKELFDDLAKYVEDPERRWTQCLRVKRGIVDMSETGGVFCKDQVYLAGAIRVLKQRKSLDFKLLYSGKVGLDDIPKIAGIAQKDDLHLPFFMKDMEAYLTLLDLIADENHIT
eukprot:TRINITY_DN644_c2_g1_i2.p1 TRINITY_DN644_c2_g1~~TRINITY_DN644_c2_g1_i2.p1  ORF type:complete len:420 (-),score=95.61 TRINITY_DN644_c2_g1_i2:2122-3276(-)